MNNTRITNTTITNTKNTDIKITDIKKDDKLTNINFYLVEGEVLNINTKSYIPETPFLNFTQTNISLPKKLFNELEKLGFSKLKFSDQKKLLFKILDKFQKEINPKITQKDVNYDKLLKNVEPIIQKLLGGAGDIVETQILSHVNEENIFVANFEISDKAYYTGPKAAVLARLVETYKEPAEVMTRPEVVEFQRDSWLTKNKDRPFTRENVPAPPQITRELLTRLIDSIKELKPEYNDVNNEDIIQLFLQSNTKSFLEECLIFKPNEFFIQFKPGTQNTSENLLNPMNFRIMTLYNQYRKLADKLLISLMRSLVPPNFENFHPDIFIYSFNKMDVLDDAIKYTEDGITNIIQLDLKAFYDSVKWPVIEYLLHGALVRRFTKRYGKVIGEQIALYFIDIYLGLLTSSSISYNKTIVNFKTSLPTGAPSSTAIIAFMMDQLIWLWLPTQPYVLNHDFIIKIYVDDIVIKLLSPRIRANASIFLQGLWDFIQSFLFTINLTKSKADPALNIRVIKNKAVSQELEPLPPLKETDFYLGMPYTRDKNKFFDAILSQLLNKKEDFKQFESWLFIYNVIDHPSISRSLKWKLKVFFPQYDSYTKITQPELKDFVLQYLRTKGVVLLFEPPPSFQVDPQGNYSLPYNTKDIIGRQICLKSNLNRCGEIIGITADQKCRIKFDDGEIVLIPVKDAIFIIQSQTFFQNGKHIFVARTRVPADRQLV